MEIQLIEGHTTSTLPTAGTAEKGMLLPVNTRTLTNSTSLTRIGTLLAGQVVLGGVSPTLRKKA